MSKSFRRALLALTALILALTYQTSAAAWESGCSFCDEVCHDSWEYGIAVCESECPEATPISYWSGAV